MNRSKKQRKNIKKRSYRNQKAGEPVYCTGLKTKAECQNKGKGECYWHNGDCRFK